MICLLLPLLVAACFSPAPPDRGPGGSIHARPPARPESDRRYLFYLHGRIIETEGRRPTHPEFGVYEYDAILKTFADAGLTVISEARAPGTAVAPYAAGIVADIRGLLDAGVPPERISVVGFSKGGVIAVTVSSLLQEPRVSFVFLGACSEFLFDKADLRVSGRVLSIYEASDEMGVSCRPLLARSPAVSDRSEVVIDTGLRHGAFYASRGEWIDPALAWIQGPH